MESFIFRALGAQVGTCIASDVKASAGKFAIENHGSAITHYFESLQEMTEGVGKCRIHKTTCNIATTTPDMFIAGPPCQPFSQQRYRSGTSSKTSAAKAHPDYQVTFSLIIDHIKKFKPRVFLLEQVPGFGEQQRDGSEPLREFIRLIGPYFEACRVVELKASTWASISRDRFSLHSCYTCMSLHLMDLLVQVWK
jgi:site-specific DNA-cytosine methylase